MKIIKNARDHILKFKENHKIEKILLTLGIVFSSIFITGSSVNAYTVQDKDYKYCFILLKNDKEKKKILIEVKRANSSYLKKGYENQLAKYMYASNCKNAFYLIACFTDSEYNTAYKFIRENVYTDEIQMYINIAVLDLRKRKVPSKF